MTPRDQEEYTALRATIRERGTARVWVFVLGVAVWAAADITALALTLPPVATLVPLVVLWATYEAVRGLHIGVERIGRYLLVFHEDQWEERAGRFGRPAGALSADPLFTSAFVIASLMSTLPLLGVRPVVQELATVAVAQGLFIARLLQTRSAARRQRDVDTARFLELKNQR